MDIIKKAKEYAKGKALDAISAAIEQAYADGYNEGYNDGINSRAESSEELIGVVKFVNLKLSSGTEWSSTYIKDSNNMAKFFTYKEASKYEIPSLEDYQELLRECKIRNVNNPNNPFEVKGVLIVGENGEVVNLPYTSFLYEAKLPSNYVVSGSFMFWLKDDQEGKDRLCADNGIRDKSKRIFMGLKLPMMLVRKTRKI